MSTRMERLFAERGVEIGSIFIMRPATAIEFVGQCERNGVNILGVEGFKRIGNGIQPQQEDSCDYESSPADSHQRTIRFIASRLDSDVWFEVVTDEKLE